MPTRAERAMLSCCFDLSRVCDGGILWDVVGWNEGRFWCEVKGRVRVAAKRIGEKRSEQLEKR